MALPNDIMGLILRKKIKNTASAIMSTAAIETIDIISHLMDGWGAGGVGSGGMGAGGAGT